MAIAHADEYFWIVPRGHRAPGRARALLRERLRVWRVDPDTADAAELVVSELVTNALRHSGAPQGRGIGVRLARRKGGVRVEVSDAGAVVDLAPQVTTECDERGRGLAIVAALAERWGCLPRPHGIGKAVWAEVGPSSQEGSASW
ncbi:ATP-binding protein [Streptomyces cirratus]|uniref:ATP-binding protein n=1 Tax=Streptomyces cirratus TaxID=68187 RepID=A0ABQ3EI97_9ACTN|nr:ATP-binding protein [Streptomyces cirratus]GHB40687.1 ATP-binding protein [Streptomyces cirratus]